MTGTSERALGQRGFSLIEILVSVLVFTMIAGMAFLFMDTAQQRHRSEADYLDSFQGARLFLDQLARDVHMAGFPPPNLYASAALVAANVQNVAVSPFAWSPNYPANPCVPDVCTVPGPYDLILEMDIDPENDNGVEWVRYRLNGTTIWRGAASKVAGADPDAATLPALLPYVENVMNNPSGPEMAAIRAENPGMFPGGTPVPVFTYAYLPGAPALANTILEVNVTLIVQSENRDPKTQRLRLATLTGRARIINPSK